MHNARGASSEPAQVLHVAQLWCRIELTAALAGYGWAVQLHRYGSGFLQNLTFGVNYLRGDAVLATLDIFQLEFERLRL